MKNRKAEARWVASFAFVSVFPFHLCKESINCGITGICSRVLLCCCFLEQKNIDFVGLFLENTCIRKSTTKLQFNNILFMFEETTNLQLVNYMKTQIIMIL